MLVLFQWLLPGSEVLIWIWFFMWSCLIRYRLLLWYYLRLHLRWRLLNFIVDWPDRWAFVWSIFVCKTDIRVHCSCQNNWILRCIKGVVSQRGAASSINFFLSNCADIRLSSIQTSRLLLLLLIAFIWYYSGWLNAVGVIWAGYLRGHLRVRLLMQLHALSDDQLFSFDVKIYKTSVRYGAGV